MSDNVVDDMQAEDGTWFRAILEVDEDATNPREWDNGGVIDVINQSRYNVPQEGDSAVRYNVEDHDFRVVARWLRMFHGATVVLPLYGGSGYGGEFNISAGNVDDTPEHGNYIGVTYDTPETRKVTGITDWESMAGALAAEVQEYSRWAAGDAYGYVIQVNTAGDPFDDDAWEGNEDSVWGFIGTEYAEQEAKRALADWVSGYEQGINPITSVTMPRPRFSLSVATDTDAFTEHTGTELARILRAVADEVETALMERDKGVLDGNGNSVGSWSYSLPAGRDSDG